MGIPGRFLKLPEVFRVFQKFPKDAEDFKRVSDLF